MWVRGVKLVALSEPGGGVGWSGPVAGRATPGQPGRKLPLLRTLPDWIKVRVKKPCAETRVYWLVVVSSGAAGQGRTPARPPRSKSTKSEKRSGRRAEEEEAGERGGEAFCGSAASLPGTISRC